MPVPGDFGTLLNETPATKDFFGGERHPHLYKKKYNSIVIKGGLKIITKSIMTMIITNNYHQINNNNNYQLVHPGCDVLLG